MKRPRTIGFILGAFALVGLILSWSPAAPAQEAGRPTPDPAVGQQAYLDNCARCHGATGAGDGRDADTMFPRPRPLADGVFKFRTTASGSPPTDEDLYHTISEGLPGSRMPDFTRLPEETRWQLVYYVKGLSPIFQEQKPEPLDLGSAPGPKGANLARGKELYVTLGCNACHGAAGRGNGPSAPTLVDQWQRPIQAADLTQGWSYRSGSSPRDVLTRLMTGLDGTPMPSYAEAVSAQEVWDLAYYVHSIQEEPRWGRRIRAARLEGPLPAGPDDPGWKAAPRTDLRLSSTHYENGQVKPTLVNAISVQVLYNEQEILFRLAWHDRTDSRESPPDAAAIILFADPRIRWEIGSLRSWPANPRAPKLESWLWTAGWESAQQAVVQDVAELAEGKVPGRPLESAAAHTDGEWVLLIRRPLNTPVAGDLTLERGQGFTIGFMVWDGGNGESGRHRANSNWLDLAL